MVVTVFHRSPVVTGQAHRTPTSDVNERSPHSPVTGEPCRREGAMTGHTEVEIPLPGKACSINRELLESWQDPSPRNDQL